MQRHVARLVEDGLAGTRDFEVVGLAIELAVMLLEGLQIQHQVAFAALHAELVVGGGTDLEGLHGINGLRAIGALGRHFLFYFFFVLDWLPWR